MADKHNAAEQLDEDVLGTDPRVDDLPGLNQFVETGPMSAEDPTLLTGPSDAPDSVILRSWREEPEVGETEIHIERRETGSLVEDVDPSDGDDEAQLLGRFIQPSDGHVGPEDAAIRIEPESEANPGQ